MCLEEALLFWAGYNDKGAGVEGIFVKQIIVFYVYFAFYAIIKTILCVCGVGGGGVKT